jgi:hypothetical protein
MHKTALLSQTTQLHPQDTQTQTAGNTSAQHHAPSPAIPNLPADSALALGFSPSAALPPAAIIAESSAQIIAPSPADTRLHPESSSALPLVPCPSEALPPADIIVASSAQIIAPSPTLTRLHADSISALPLVFRPSLALPLADIIEESSAQINAPSPACTLLHAASSTALPLLPRPSAALPPADIIAESSAQLVAPSPADTRLHPDSSSALPLVPRPSAALPPADIIAESSAQLVAPSPAVARLHEPSAALPLVLRLPAASPPVDSIQAPGSQAVPSPSLTTDAFLASLTADVSACTTPVVPAKTISLVTDNLMKASLPSFALPPPKDCAPRHFTAAPPRPKQFDTLMPGPSMHGTLICEPPITSPWVPSLSGTHHAKPPRSAHAPSVLYLRAPADFQWPQFTLFALYEHSGEFREAWTRKGGSACSVSAPQPLCRLRPTRGILWARCMSLSRRTHCRCTLSSRTSRVAQLIGHLGRRGPPNFLAAHWSTPSRRSRGPSAWAHPQPRRSRTQRLSTSLGRQPLSPMASTLLQRPRHGVGGSVLSSR